MGDSEARSASAEGPPVGPPKRLATASLVLTMVVSVIASTFGQRAFLASVLAAFLLIHFPVVSLATRTEDLDLGPRAAFYRVTAIMLLFLGALSGGAWWLLPEGGYGELVILPSPATLALESLMLLGACLLVMGGFHVLGRTMGWRERPIVSRLMPEGSSEKRTFVFLSSAAGLGEEVAYRGFLPIYLAPWTGSYLLASVPCAVAFGCLHMYQGIHGVFRTGLIGLVLAAGVAATDSLWPAVVAHALLNVLVGLVLKDALLGTQEGTDPRHAPAEPPVTTYGE